MAKEAEKDFNARLNDGKDMPKIIDLDAAAAAKWGGKTMVVAPPLEYDALMKKVPKGKLITTNMLREKIAKNHNVEITCPLTCGIFTNIVAWASYQRDGDATPFWRAIKSNGELNSKFPEYPKLQKELLEAEGHEVFEKRGKYFVKDFEGKLVDWDLCSHLDASGSIKIQGAIIKPWGMVQKMV